jgi:GT2 family glycosyltransferase
MHEHLHEAVESLQKQSYEPLEIVIVVDGNLQLFRRVENIYGDIAGITEVVTETNLGLSGARNVGIKHARGEVVAFIDDDALADPRWIKELVHVYQTTDAIAVGGAMTPIWVAGEPSFLPREFYWLVGVTPPGFAAPGEEVRNTFGSNISFRRAVFDTIGGFNESLGRSGSGLGQGEETEFCARMRANLGKGVIYAPRAMVGHKVFAWRKKRRWLLARAFWHGYSKRAMERLVSTSARAEEGRYLRLLLTKSMPQRVAQLVRGPDLTGLAQLVSLGILTLAVGLGYLYGVLRL